MSCFYIEVRGRGLCNEAWAPQQDLLEEGFAGEGVKGFQEMYNSYFGIIAIADYP